MTDYTLLTAFLDASMPKIQATWRRYWVQGREARKRGERRAIHARRSHKGMWLLGWDEEDKHQKQLAKRRQAYRRKRETSDD